MRDVRKHRTKLHNDAKGRCHYCSVETVHPTGENDTQPNMATIDHLYSRFHPLRFTRNDRNERRHVLSCFRCNQQRARLEEISQFLTDGVFYLLESGGRIEQRKQSVNGFSTVVISWAGRVASPCDDAKA